MNKLNRVTLLLLMPLMLFPVAIRGMETQSKNTVHRIPEINSKVKIDGILDDAIWKNALVLTLDYEVDPGENIAPPVKTEVRLANSTKYFYIAFQAYDPNPEKIRANVTDRDNIANDDYVGIVLDTFNDSRYTYNFYCNPYGIQSDQVVGINDAGDQWDGIWKSAGKINKKGYCVEIAIPFSTLRFQRKKGEQVWGIDAIRNYPRNLTHMIGLFPRDRSNNCYMCQAPKVKGYKNTKPGKNMEFTPTLSGHYSQVRTPFPDGKFTKKSDNLEPGITARWSFTPNMTISATVNPDFSQVEADVAQLDINNQFALFYPEKRPFFLEGYNIFKSRFYVIYPRSIADPEWGVKLTGKEGKHAIGFFTVRDSITNFIIPSSLNSRMASLDMNNISSALRYRMDVGKSSTLGIVATNRQGDDYFNRIAGIDGDLRFTKKDQLMFQIVGSQTDYPDGFAVDYSQPEDKFSGHAMDFMYTHGTQNVFFYAHYQNVSSGFRSDVGFNDQTGIKLYDFFGRYTWRKNPGHWYTMIHLGGVFYYMTDFDNQLLLRRYKSWLTYYGPSQSYINIQGIVGRKNYLGKEFRDNNLTFQADFRPAGDLNVGISGFIGDQVDFTNVQAGKRFMLNPLIQYNLGKHFYMAMDYIYERLNVEGGRLYTANLGNFRFVYQFNSRTFLRTILQYADYKYNTSLYTIARDPRFKHLFSQILFSYKINPQTVLFLGYSDDYYGDHTLPLKQNNRTIFLKIGYALVL